MARISAKTFSSKYKYVCRRTQNGKEFFTITMDGYSIKHYLTEKEAGIAIDKILISKGKEPINVLIRKKIEKL